MTKTLPERFAELIEQLILILEAQLADSFLPNRLGAPMLSLARKSLLKINASFAAALARLAATPAPRPQTEAQKPSRPKPIPARPGWLQRLTQWRPNWLTPEPPPSASRRHSQPSIRLPQERPRNQTPKAPSAPPIKLSRATPPCPPSAAKPPRPIPTPKPINPPDPQRPPTPPPNPKPKIPIFDPPTPTPTHAHFVTI